jgi:hypothetical protein
MAERKVDHEKDNKHKFELKDSKNSVLEGVDGDAYDVYTETSKLARAQEKKSDCTWFVSFLIKKKGNTDPTNDALNYTVKFDKPGKDEDGVQVFYFLNDTVYEVTNYQTEENGKKIKFTLTVGDPPLGTVP